ncbi:hypothetical protein ACFV3F_26220 [Streptomyces sp. NPDC059717]|uniref:hypothetical protein n=1 Tax=Streptomyces sp. NPDC059717 TaxID=3346922 RepID=UPI0036C1062A
MEKNDQNKAHEIGRSRSAYGKRWYGVRVHHDIGMVASKKTSDVLIGQHSAQKLLAPCGT